ncbi:MAG: phospholipase A [Gammaproteobacteria bacterium]
MRNAAANPRPRRVPARARGWRSLLFAAVLAVGAAEARGQDPAETPAPDSPENTPQRVYQSPLDKRIELEQMSQDNPFVLTSHKPTYLLPIAYNSRPNGEAVGEDGGDLDHIEIKFQFSMKFTVWRRLFGDNGHLSLAYTQQAWWQAYNDAISSPFRETNHEPEAMLTFYTDFDVLGMRNRMMVFGFVHQSNGRTEETSRSWNRLYANFILERRNLAISLRPWYRIPESAKDDDNPDIDDYLGYGDLGLSYDNERNVYSLLLRNNLRFGDNHGAVQLDWSFPLKDRIKGYVQVFSGYGESLIDYNRSVTRLGFGIMLNDWL